MVCATGLADAALLVQQRDDGHDCVLPASPGAPRTAPPREPVARTTRSWYRLVRCAPRADTRKAIDFGAHVPPDTLRICRTGGMNSHNRHGTPLPGGIPATGHTSHAGGAG